jgi:hypothetical protein
VTGQKKRKEPTKTAGAHSARPVTPVTTTLAYVATSAQLAIAAADFSKARAVPG